MTYKIIIFTRDDIITNPETLVNSNDKRKELIKRFDYLNKVSIKKIENTDITLSELEKFYNEEENNLISNDIMVFIDDRSVSMLDAPEISTTLTYIQNIVLTDYTDIFYFANSMDNCQTKTSYKEPVSDTIKQINFYKTKSPNGFFAVGAYKSKWKDILTVLKNRYEFKVSSKLSGAVNDGELKAGTSYPRIFTPDINRITENIDIIHTYPCYINEDYMKKKPSRDEMALYWFTVGIIIVILIIWLLNKFLL